MAYIREADRKTLQDLFGREVAGPATLVVFRGPGVGGGEGAGAPRRFDAETEALAREVAGLSEKISVEVVDVETPAGGEKARALRVARTPAIAVVGARDRQGSHHRVRFYGIPLGYEFRTLVDAIIDVSRGRTGLRPETRERLGTLASDVHIQVFSTPT